MVGTPSPLTRWKVLGVARIIYGERMPSLREAASIGAYHECVLLYVS